MGVDERRLSQQEVSDFLGLHSDLEVVELLVPDINGVLRGKWLEKSKLEKLCDGHVRLPKTSLAFDIWGADISRIVFEHGDPDAICLPVQGSLLPVPWAKRPTGQVLAGMYDEEKAPMPEDPQAILLRVLGLFDEMDLRPVVATELEFYLLDKACIGEGRKPAPATHRQTEAGIAGPQAYSADVLALFDDLIYRIVDNAKAQNLPVSTLVKEASTSQFEVNLNHTPAVMTAADQTVLLKRLIKSSSLAHDFVSTFMAKPFSDLSGNGFHVHMSLLDEAGKNVFDDGSLEGSESLRFAVEGLLRNMPDLMSVFAPNINSYRRFQPGSHAPLVASWGYDNRTTAIRIPGGDHHSRRFEHRVAGADANPYLVLAGILACVHDGLTNRRRPSAPVVGNAYREGAESLPSNWVAAMTRFKGSAFIDKYFGGAFVNYYTASKEQELASLGMEVTSLEHESYLGLI